MAKELTWRKAIDKVLAASATPLHYNEITERIIADGLRTNRLKRGTVTSSLAASDDV